MDKHTYWSEGTQDMNWLTWLSVAEIFQGNWILSELLLKYYHMIGDHLMEPSLPPPHIVSLSRFILLKTTLERHPFKKKYYLWPLDMTSRPLPFSLHTACPLVICQLTNEFGWDLCILWTFKNNITSWNIQKCATKAASALLVLIFGLDGTKVMLGCFRITKMYSLLMQVRGMMKNMLWNPADRELNHLFFSLDLFIHSIWF